MVHCNHLPNISSLSPSVEKRKGLGYRCNMKILLPQQELDYIRERCKVLGFRSLREYESSPLWWARREKYYQAHKYICAAAASFWRTVGKRETHRCKSP